MGGGGTDISVVIRSLKEMNVEPKVLIIFTDLESSEFGDPNFCPVVWLVNNPWNKAIVPPFGTWVRYEKDEGVVETGEAG